MISVLWTGWPSNQYSLTDASSVGPPGLIDMPSCARASAVAACTVRVTVSGLVELTARGWYCELRPSGPEDQS